jgi:hypothetical protein
MKIKLQCVLVLFVLVLTTAGSGSACTHREEHASASVEYGSMVPCDGSFCPASKVTTCTYECVTDVPCGTDCSEGGSATSTFTEWYLCINDECEYHFDDDIQNVGVTVTACP